MSSELSNTMTHSLSTSTEFDVSSETREYLTSFILNEYGYETQKYMSSLLLNNDFNLLDSIWEYVQVIDLNCDHNPEVIIECSPFSIHEKHYSYVFSNNRNKVFTAKEIDSETQYSYYGGIVKSYLDNDGNSIFITDILYGGVQTGEFGQDIINFDGYNIYMNNIYRYNWNGDNHSIQYQYFNKDFTSDDNNHEYEQFISSLVESESFDDYVKLRDEDYIPFEKNQTYKIIAELLDKFYYELNSEESSTLN